MAELVFGLCTAKDARPFDIFIHAVCSAPTPTNSLEPADAQKNLNRLKNGEKNVKPITSKPNSVTLIFTKSSRGLLGERFRQICTVNGRAQQTQNSRLYAFKKGREWGGWEREDPTIFVRSVRIFDHLLKGPTKIQGAQEIL